MSAAPSAITASLSRGRFLAGGFVALLIGGCAPADPEIDEQPYLNDPDVAQRQMAAMCPNGGEDYPIVPGFGPGIDGYAPYDGQDTCDPTAKPGVEGFRDLVLVTYPCTTSLGITRSCSAGGMSEHKEGRAWDWGIDYPHPAADALLSWLLATDAHGNPHAMARRFGIMYMIWNSQIWKSYQAASGWQTYTGASPHTDHVHFSFSWAGALKQTTFWTSSLPLDSGPVLPPDFGAPLPPDQGSAFTDSGTPVPPGDAMSGGDTLRPWPGRDRGSYPSDMYVLPSYDDAGRQIFPAARGPILWGGCSVSAPGRRGSSGGALVGAALVLCLALLGRAGRGSRRRARASTG